jgi:preprotein translocase SecF subunit
VNFNFSNFDFIGQRKKFFAFSIIITLLGVLTLSIFGLNLGVDFKSGTTLDITLKQATTSSASNALFKEAGVTPSQLTIGGADDDRVSARFKETLSEKKMNEIVTVFEEKYGKISHEENTVDASIAREFALKTILYIGIAALGIIIYVTIRFEWRFAVAAIIALLHDAFIVISLFSIFRLEVNLPFIAAILTIIGYSINDTIVIFDRVRENLRFAKLKSFQDIIDVVNMSVRQTFVRSINTVMTVFICSLALLIFGSPAVRVFSMAMLFGLVSGAYSSIFIASPLWIVLKNRSLKKANAEN